MSVATLVPLWRTSFLSVQWVLSLPLYHEFSYLFNTSYSWSISRLIDFFQTKKIPVFQYFDKSFCFRYLTFHFIAGIVKNNIKQMLQVHLFLLIQDTDKTFLHSSVFLPNGRIQTPQFLKVILSDIKQSGSHPRH